MVVTSDPRARPGRTRRLVSAVASFAAAAVIATSCGSSQPSLTASEASPAETPHPTRSPSPLGPPVLGIDWGKAPSVERPEDAFAQPSAGASLAAPEGTGRSGHPLHFPGQAMLVDLAALPSGELVSIGYVYPGWHPAAWTSTDAMSWA